MQRRQFLTLLGGAVAISPLATRAQDALRMRRIGMLSGVGRDAPDAQLRYAAFLERQSLHRLDCRSSEAKHVIWPAIYSHASRRS